MIIDNCYQRLWLLIGQPPIWCWSSNFRSCCCAAGTPFPPHFDCIPSWCQSTGTGKVVTICQAFEHVLTFSKLHHLDPFHSQNNYIFCRNFCSLLSCWSLNVPRCRRAKMLHLNIIQILVAIRWATQCPPNHRVSYCGDIHGQIQRWSPIFKWDTVCTNPLTNMLLYHNRLHPIYELDGVLYQCWSRLRSWLLPLLRWLW